MIYSANLLAILIPIILLQYGASLFCLVKLVFLDLPKKKFFLWNFFILIVVGIGVITFLVCYFKFRDKVFPKKQEPEENKDAEIKQETEESDAEKNSETSEPEIPKDEEVAVSVTPKNDDIEQ